MLLQSFFWSFDPIPVRWIWVALVVVFALIEVFTLSLTTVWFALAALVMVFLSFLPIPLHFQVLIFLVLSGALLYLTWPLVKKYRIPKEKTNVDSLIGKHALVTRQITEFDKGEVKLSGQFWSARLEDDSPIKEIKEGTKCEVVRIEGVQAIVRPLPTDTNETQETN